MQQEIFADFRLVGRTSLSLQLGHRMSIDIDLFTDQHGSINKAAIDQFLNDHFPYVDTAGTSKDPATFRYYSQLSSFLAEHDDYENFAAGWILSLLKDVKIKLEKAIKNGSKPDIFNAIAYYHSIPDMDMTNAPQLDSYSELLQAINAYEARYNLKVMPLKNNIVQELNDGKVILYALPEFSLVRNYMQNEKEKLGIYHIDLNTQELTFNFQLQMIPTFIDEQGAREASMTKGNEYGGIYMDWTLDGFDFSIEGIDKRRSTITKVGDKLDIKLVIDGGNRLALALLFGNGNFFVKLSCHGNRDSDYKFELNLPVNMRY